MDAKRERTKYESVLYSSMTTDIEDLISEMQAVKLEHPILELQEILEMFNIRALSRLTSQLKRLANK